MYHPDAMNVTVLGSGSWGTALTILLARNGHDVTLVGRDVEEVQMLRSRRENLRYLPGFAVPEGARFQRFDEGVGDADMTVVAVPSSAVREVLTALTGAHPFLILAAKGLEPGTAKLMTEVASECCPNSVIGVLSGPNLAVEIARGVPTVAVSACVDEVAACRARDAFSCATFRVSTSNDVVGIELAGALKNVLAIGAGMSDGLGFGDNTKGAFLSRGLMEIARLGSAMGARAETFLGPAGVGDLFATAVSRLSRNYRLGRALGEGSTLKDALEHLGQVAEGVPTSEATLMLARKYGVEMPVFAAVDGVVRGRLTPRSAVQLLMERTAKMDHFLRADPL